MSLSSWGTGLDLTCPRLPYPTYTLLNSLHYLMFLHGEIIAIVLFANKLQIIVRLCFMHKVHGMLWWVRRSD